MKRKNTDELWIQNRTKTDVHVSDLGVKVRSGDTINVFRSNPYLTTQQVLNSLALGALAQRVSEKVLKVVKGKTVDRPMILDQIKDGKGHFYAKKTKTSVVIDKESEDLGRKDAFDFADYGVRVSEAAERVKQDVGIVVKQKEDVLPPTIPAAKVEPKIEGSNISNQSVVVMHQTQQLVSNPMGVIADAHINPGKGFYVAKPPQREEEKSVELKVSKKEGVIVVEKAEAPESEFGGKWVAINDKGNVQASSGGISEEIEVVKAETIPPKEGVMVVPETRPAVESVVAPVVESKPAVMVASQSEEKIDGSIIMQVAESEEVK